MFSSAVFVVSLWSLVAQTAPKSPCWVEADLDCVILWNIITGYEKSNWFKGLSLQLCPQALGISLVQVGCLSSLKRIKRLWSYQKIRFLTASLSDTHTRWNPNQHLCLSVLTSIGWFCFRGPTGTCFQTIQDLCVLTMVQVLKMIMKSRDCENILRHTFPIRSQHFLWCCTAPSQLYWCRKLQVGEVVCAVCCLLCGCR